MRAAMARPIARRLSGQGLAQHGGASHTRHKEYAAKSGGKAGGTLSIDCKECGREFSTNTRASRYCSDDCRLDGRRRRVRESTRRYMADPEKHAIALARSRANDARRRKQAGMGKRRLHAGHGAGAAAATTAAAPSKQATCRLCGRSFAKYGGTRHAYCKECTARADRKVGRVMRVQCAQCGKEFSTTHSRVRYCSAACGAEARRIRDREHSQRRLVDPEKRAGPAAHARAAGARRSRDADSREEGQRPNA